MLMQQQTVVEQIKMSQLRETAEGPWADLLKIVAFDAQKWKISQSHIFENPTGQGSNIVEVQVQMSSFRVDVLRHTCQT